VRLRGAPPRDSARRSPNPCRRIRARTAWLSIRRSGKGGGQRTGVVDRQRRRQVVRASVRGSPPMPTVTGTTVVADRSRRGRKSSHIAVMGSQTNGVDTREGGGRLGRRTNRRITNRSDRQPRVHRPVARGRSHPRAPERPSRARPARARLRRQRLDQQVRAPCPAQQPKEEHVSPGTWRSGGSGTSLSGGRDGGRPRHRGRIDADAPPSSPRGPSRVRITRRRNVVGSTPTLDERAVRDGLASSRGGTPALPSAENLYPSWKKERLGAHQTFRRDTAIRKPAMNRPRVFCKVRRRSIYGQFIDDRPHHLSPKNVLRFTIIRPRSSTREIRRLAQQTRLK